MTIKKTTKPKVQDGPYVWWNESVGYGAESDDKAIAIEDAMNSLGDGENFLIYKFAGEYRKEVTILAKEI